MAVNIELYPLANQILEKLIANLGLNKAAVLLLDGTSIYDVISKGFDNGLRLSYEQLAPLLSSRQIITLNQIQDPTLKEVFNLQDLGLARVLWVEQNILGIILLGKKANGRAFSKKEIKTLDVLFAEVSIALSNSQSYDKIKQFNITLSQAVKSATTSLEEANARLMKLDKAKDDFVSIASHELRTPMTAIRSYAWMALHKPDVELTEKMKKYLSRILISTERSINLVNDLLNVSRLEAGHIEFRVAPMDLTVTLHDVIEELEPKINEKSLRLKLAPTKLPPVMADAEKIHQVLMNLVSNAIKFTPNEGFIEIDFLCDGVMVETHIKDSGVGLHKEDISRLFTKFGRLDSSYVAAATAGGTGLGLYISKAFVDYMHGRMWAESAGMGQGSTFSFALPVARQTTIQQASKYVPLSAEQINLVNG